MDYIGGEGREQIILMPERVEEYVDSNNAVRVIEAYIDTLNLGELGFTQAELKGTGRPPYDPKDLLKLYVYGYLNRIRSSRRLETESYRNVELIWLMRRLRPDHKTIARFRHENGKALKQVFRNFVKLCVQLDLYGKELEAIDGSKFKAVNSRSRNYTKDQILKKIEGISAKIEEYLQELERNDAVEAAVAGEKSAEEIKDIVRELHKRKERYQGYAEELAESGETQKSLTDSESRLMASNGKMDVCYNVQTVTDAKHQLITAFEVSNQCNDKNFITPMAEKAKELLEVEKIAVVTDNGYESIGDILRAKEQGIAVHVAGTDFDVCVPAKEDEQSVEITGHHRGRCAYVAERNIALCPMGKVLYPAFHTTTKRGVGVFHNYAACKQCVCKCTTDKRGRFKYLVPMAASDFSKAYNDRNLAVKQIRIKPDKALVKQRKSIAEHPFGTIKRAMDAGYCLTKGLKNVTGEFSLLFLAYNLKRVITILGCGKLIAAMV